MTDLFATSANFVAATIESAIPPSVRRPLDTTSRVHREANGVVIDAGPWIPRTPARHLLPSLAFVTRSPWSVRFELSVRRERQWSAWVGTTTLGDVAFPQLPAEVGGLRVEIDEIHADPPAEEIRVRARVGGEAAAEIAECPWLLTLSAWDGRRQVRAPERAPAQALRVPARSQMQEDEVMRARICSPTSTAMVMEYFGAPVATAALATDVFHPPTDRYGLWPAAIKAAAAHGVPGYLLRFPDSETLQWCLERELPVVASIRYADHELSGAPMPQTSGHLVVISGVDGADVLVNDPAATTPMEVPRRYRLDEFLRAWLGGSGVGYVFFRR